jgi:cell division protein FtsB
MKILLQYYQMLLFTTIVVLMTGLFFLIIVGHNGLIDFGENGRINNEIQESNRLKTERIVDLYNRVQRLKGDTTYIENVVRHELGVIDPSEVVVKIQAPGKG